MLSGNGWKSALCLASVALGVLGLVAPAANPRKKLVEWGWDEPDTAFLHAHIREMEKTPFDGCVFSVRYGAGGSGGSFTWEFWGRHRFERADLANAFTDLATTRFRHFREVFLRVNVTPADLDWFDDFSPIIANARLAGELAHAGHARGILLDVEQYNGQLFEYRRQKHAETRPWEEYAAQARTRGRDVMTALQEGHPDLTVFLTFGHTLPWVLSDHGRKPLSEAPYGLLAPFLDGLLDAASGQTRIVDGYELSYGFKDPRQFDDARRLFESEVLPIVADPRRYRSRMQLGFGLWLDYDWRRHGWDVRESSRNYFSPDAFETSLKLALRASDEYVWVYSETPRWWGSATPQAQVPEAYGPAMRHARATAR
jgi:hypothetical protein